MLVLHKMMRAFYLILYLFLFGQTMMVSKRARGWDATVLPPAQRLRRHVQDLTGLNALPARRIQEIINDMSEAGVEGFAGMRRPLGTNIARNLRNTTLRQPVAARLARIRVLNKRTGREEMQNCAFWLPQEVVHTLLRYGESAILMDDSGLDDVSRELLREREELADCKLLGLGLWGDGVPCNWDRTESVEVFSLNLPGQGSTYKTLRIPLVAVSKNKSRKTPWTTL